MVRAAKRSAQLILAGAVMAAVVGPATAAAAPIFVPAPAQQVQLAWTVEAATDLKQAIEASRGEGLNPTDYDLARLARAIESGPSPLLDAVAGASARALAHDYAFGRVADREAMDWYIGGGSDPALLVRGLDQAVIAGKPRAFIESLLPTHPRYIALRSALAEAGDQASRDRLRANMERWRWMRANSARTISTSTCPATSSGGERRQAMSTYTVIVGAKDTPTPQLASPASSLVVNPWWYVPQSIVKSSNLRPGRGGYVFKANADGSMSVRQPPGPRNSLGKIKINLINDHAIYLHDTPAKAAFVRDDRALSHGCIRVKDIDQLAAELIDRSGDDGRFETALAGTQTETVQLGKTWQVYLVYFTADTDDSGQVVTLGDPYDRDAALIARLDGGVIQMAAR